MTQTPSVNFTILSGGLGNQPASPSQTICVFGCSSGGIAATVAGPYQGNGSQIVSDNGYGPGVELAAYLAQAGISTLFCKLATATQGTVGTVTHTGTGASVLTLTGNPSDAYNVVVTCVRSGTAGTAPEPGFTLSFDGGQTVTGEIRMPSNHIYAGFAAVTGLTFNFTAATMVAGDTYTFSTTAPTWDDTALQNGVNALRDSAKLAGLTYVVGPMASADASVYATALGGFKAKKKFIRGLGETVNQATDGSQTISAWQTAIETDYATFASDLVGIAAGGAIIPSSLTGFQFLRTIGWAAIRRAALVAISRDLAAVEDGALVGVNTISCDELLNPGLNAERFIVGTSISGLPGYYICNPNMMSGPTSDFTLLQYGRVMDEACRIEYNFFVQKLSTSVRLEKSGPRKGFILERDARALESGSDSALAAGLVNTGDVSDATTTVSRVDNISSTKTLTVTVSLLPLGYIKTINETLTFVNPALGT
jgi:hypothetical protein